MLETRQEEEARGVEDEITIRGVKPWDPVLNPYPVLAGCKKKKIIPIRIPQVLVYPAQIITGLRPEPGLSFPAAVPAGRPAGFWRPLPGGKRHATPRASATREGPGPAWGQD